MYNGSIEPISDQFPVVPKVDIASFFEKESEDEDGNESNDEAD